MAKFIYLILGCFITVSCKNSDDQEVRSSFKNFNHFYQQQKDYRKIPKPLLSENLIYYIDLAKQKEKQSAENIKQSDFPTDKPEIIEGDIFSSLYEGFNEYKILNSTIKKDTAQLQLELTNTNFKPITIWNDECILVKQNGQWKVDNFIFGKLDNAGFESTQNIFKSFLHFENPPEK